MEWGCRGEGEGGRGEEESSWGDGDVADKESLEARLW